MKKTILPLWLGCAFFALSGMNVAAQECKVQVYTLENNPALDEEMQGSMVQSVSANGEYATGYGDVYSECGFIWSKATGQFSLLDGSFDGRCYGYGVSNDGTVAGVYTDDNGGEVKEGKTPYWVPGIWKDGKWTPLELIVPKSVGNANGEARWISGDGRIVTGYVKDYFTRTINLEEKQVALYRPAVWIDGKLQPKWENYPSGDEVQQGCFSMYGSSEDGKVIAGFYEFPSGSRAPAVWVDGVLHTLYRTADIDTDVDEYFFGGQCSTVSPNGKYVGGYFAPYGDDGYSPSTGFIYDVEAKSLIEPEDCYMVYSVLGDGTAFGTTSYMGPLTVYAGDQSRSYEDYLTSTYAAPEDGHLPSAVISSSVDGKVMGGYFATASDLGLLMHPSIVCVEGGQTGIASASVTKAPLAVRYGVVMADGAQKVEIFDMQGRNLGAAQTSAISLGAHRGAIVAKATYADGEVKTAKFQVK